MQHLSLLINDDGLELCLPSTSTSSHTSDGDPPQGARDAADEHGGGVGVVVALWGFTKVEEWESGYVGHTKGMTPDELRIRITAVHLPAHHFDVTLNILEGHSAKEVEMSIEGVVAEIVRRRQQGGHAPRHPDDFADSEFNTDTNTGGGGGGGGGGRRGPDLSKEDEVIQAMIDLITAACDEDSLVAAMVGMQFTVQSGCQVDRGIVTAIAAERKATLGEGCWTPSVQEAYVEESI